MTRRSPLLLGVESRTAPLPCRRLPTLPPPPPPRLPSAVLRPSAVTRDGHAARSRLATPLLPAASAGTRYEPWIPAARGHDGDTLETVASVPGATRTRRTSRVRRYGDDVRGCLWRHASDLRVRLQSYAGDSPVRLQRYRDDSRDCLRRLSGDTSALRGFISGDTRATDRGISGVATDTHRGHPGEIQRCIARRHGAYR